MVRVSIEVRSGAARFRVGVQAASIHGAVSLVKGFYPAGDARVLFPIDAEVFFVKDSVDRAGIANFERAKGMAA